MDDFREASQADGPPLVDRGTAAAADIRGGLVEFVHTAVAGRARLRVAGLRRSPAVQRTLERGMPALPGVRSAAASTLTGNLLVHFDPATPLAVITARAAALVRGDVLPPEEAREPPAGAAGPDWHARGAAEVAAALGVGAASGLSTEEARARLAEAGANALPQPPERSGLDILLGQFRSLPVALLAGAAVVSFATGGALEAVAILGVVALNGGIGFGVESRSERTIRGLGDGPGRTAAVLRDGTEAEVPIETVVPGDLLVLRRGTVVPADARVVSASDLTVSEAMLTGESLPVRKTAAPIARRPLPLGERANMVHRGTVVTGGGGRAIAVATGPATEMGRIQALVGGAAAPPTPMQRQLDDVGGRVA